MSVQSVQAQSIQIVEMTRAASLLHVTRNIECGQSTVWDADYLKSVGIKLTNDQEFRISHGLTTADDSENIWDDALFRGVI